MASELIAYIDGAFVPESMATISIYDRGFLFGDLVTESTRTFRLRPFKLHEHLERLADSLKATQIVCNLGLAELEEVTLDLLERNRDRFGPEDEAWIVHNISRGIASFGRRPGYQYRPSTIVVHCFPIDFASLVPQYREGVHVVVPSTRQLPPQCLDPKIKHRSRMHMTLAALEAERVDPAALPVLLDLEGNLTESIGANFFIVAQGLVRTPGTHGVLRGISRATVLDLCAQLGIPAREEQIQPYDALIASEAFLTSTPYCILPVTRFNGQLIGDGRPGPITEQLLRAWSEMVGVDIAGQAKQNWRSK